MAWRAAPRMSMGAWLSVREMSAPICERGLRMRSMGRRVRDSSPMRVNSPCCAARKPASMRIVEPELPQSSGEDEGRNWPPTPVTSTLPSPLLTTFAPRAWTQARLLEGSAPVEKLVKRLVPSASPARSA